MQQRDGALYAGLAAGDRRVEERAADPDEVGTERQRLDHIAAAADAAVDHDGHAFGFSRDFRQRAQARYGVIELAAAMVGEHHPVDAARARDAGVLRRDQTLDDQLALPALADQLDMLPGELV